VKYQEQSAVPVTVDHVASTSHRLCGTSRILFKSYHVLISICFIRNVIVQLLRVKSIFCPVWIATLFDVFAGRIHSAVISGLNLETNSATVEWFEKNEIKGKEARISFLQFSQQLCVHKKCISEDCAANSYI